MFSYYEQYFRFLSPILKFENWVHFFMQYTIEIILSLPEGVLGWAYIGKYSAVLNLP